MQNNKLKSKKTKNSKFFRFDFLAAIFRPAWLRIFKPGRSENGGFTLIETLVAVTILSAAIAGPMALSIKNIGTASVSKDQLVAFYLGQEAIEYVRNVRDTNILSENGWLDGLGDCLPSSPNGCYIDVINNAITACEVDGCSNLKFDGQNYNYASDDNSAFIRTVKIDNLIRADGDEAKIDVAVSWTGKYGQKTMNLQDNIFNWR